MPPNTRSRNAHTPIGVEPAPAGGEMSQLVRRNTEQNAAKAQRNSGRLVAQRTGAAGRRLINVTRLVVELDDDAARRLTQRAEREGIEPSALAQRLLSEASEVDPFEFIGSFASVTVNGRDADEFLDREGFGAP